MYIILFTLIITIILNLYFGLLVIKSANKQQNRLYLLINISVMFWAIGDLMMLFLSNIILIDIGVLIFYIAPMALPISIVLFSQVVPQGITNKKYYIYALILFLALSVLLYLNIDNFVKAIIVGDTVNTIVPNKLPFTIYIFFYGLFLLLAYGNFIRRIKNSTGITLMQIKYSFYGVLISTVLAMFTNALLPFYGVYNYVWIGPPSTLIAIFAIAFAIIKYQLFEVRAAIARWLTYTLMIVIVATSYVLLVSILSAIIFQKSTIIVGVEGYINATAAVLIALSFGSVRKRFDKISDKLFFRDNYDLQLIINQINSNLVTKSKLDSILTSNVDIVQNGTKLEYVNFYLDRTALVETHIFGSNVKLFGEPEWSLIVEYLNDSNKKIFSKDIDGLDYTLYKLLNKLNIECIIKMITDSKTVGYLVLGPKKSGTDFGTRDTQLYEIIADETAIAVQSHLRLKEIERFNETLQQNVKKATADLQKSNEKLKSLDEAKDEFISMASHQLRTPLTSVKGYISMLLEGDAGPITDQQKTFLSQAFTSSQRMVYLIADLLNVSRLKTGKFVIEPTEVNLPQVVKTEVEQLQTTADSRGLTLKVDCPKDFPSLMLDETKIHQVIMNFIDNAIYYTPSGGSIKVVLSVNSKTAELRVIDTGIGVPKKAQHELFTKFYRAENAQKARPDGTGLGLYMAKKVIIAQGGFVIFSSVENKGSTFGFSFALSKVLPNKTEDSK